MQQQNPQPTRQLLFLGLTTSRRADWQKYLAEPKATRSSKPESVAKEIAEKREKQAELSQFWPVAATVGSCVILDQNGDEVFASSGGFGVPEGSVSYTALSTLARLLATGGDKIAAEPTLYDMGIRLFGLGIRDRLRIMALDALRFISQGTPADERYMIPVGLWTHKAFEAAPWCDPYEILVPSELRHDIPWDSLAEYLNIPVPQGVDLDADAKHQAEMARLLTLRGGLVCQ